MRFLRKNRYFFEQISLKHDIISCYSISNDENESYCEKFLSIVEQKEK